MARYIEENYIKSAKFHPLPYTHITPSDVEAESYKRGWNDALDAVVANAPSANVRENVHGEWIDGQCSICKCDIPVYIVDWKWQKDMDANFCPNCGADMRGEEYE